MPDFENKGQYLSVSFTEAYSLELLLSAVRETGEICRRDNLDKVLVDLRSVSTNVSIMDRYDIGVQVSKEIGGKIKVAVLGKRNLLNYMAETVAGNRGANLKVFSRVEAGLKWLGVEEKK